MKKDLSTLRKQVKDLKSRKNQLQDKTGYFFQFIDGQLIDSINKGSWILLDEINLASDEVLNRLATIV